MGDSSVADADMAIASKIEEPDRGGTPSSIDSTPELDAGAEQSQETAQPQKRKGGRKPIYATSEERKQRNRQAQAAFRERRTEYIKQLEATIKQNEESLASLQQSHRSAADECLMLRYKNSLLERILLEKGIDVQSELRMKTGSPILGPGFMHGPNVPVVQQPQPPLQRTALHQRHQARRSAGQHFLPKLAPGQSAAEINYNTASPHAHPTPSSHASSPTQSLTRSPMTMHQGGITSSSSAVLAQPQAQHMQPRTHPLQHSPNRTLFQAPQPSANASRQPQRPGPPVQYQSSASVVSNRSSNSQHSLTQPMIANAANAASSAGPAASAFYPSPFQKHFDQLDQEYDAQHARSMLDDPEPQDPSNTTSPNHAQANYPPNLEQQLTTDFYQHAQGAQSSQQPMTPQTSYEQSQMMPPTSHPLAAEGEYDVDPNDPMLDADPFGLSASMHYPTSYSFEPQSHGHGQR